MHPLDYAPKNTTHQTTRSESLSLVSLFRSLVRFLFRSVCQKLRNIIMYNPTTGFSQLVYLYESCVESR